MLSLLGKSFRVPWLFLAQAILWFHVFWEQLLSFPCFPGVWPSSSSICILSQYYREMRVHGISVHRGCDERGNQRQHLPHAAWGDRKQTIPHGEGKLQSLQSIPKRTVSYTGQNYWYEPDIRYTRGQTFCKFPSVINSLKLMYVKSFVWVLWLPRDIIITNQNNWKIFPLFYSFDLDNPLQL